MTLGIGGAGEKSDQDIKLLSTSSMNVVMAKWEQRLKGNEGLVIGAKKISFLFSPELSSSAMTDDEGPLTILPKE